ncbi:MAG: M20 family metallopeptidase [Actinobacteria bacterium]|nr:M20 family metallopeptidase [Actinomycetota bacterium]
MSGLKNRVLASSRHVAGEALALSRRIYDHPELGHQEQQAFVWCREVLESHGFEFECVPGVPTAFVAARRSGNAGPTVGFFAEYDALPELGHACGHNLIAASAVCAALSVAEVLDELPGVVKVFGCPAEELGTGKPMMLASGVFAGLDTALTFHPYHTTSVMERSTGVRKFSLGFRGKAAHAANEPWVGASALDGLLLTWNNLNALRQFARDGVRIHGMITHGGDAFNVIPDRATAVIAVRSADEAELERIAAKLRDCARAGALASGTGVTIELEGTLEPVKPNRVLTGLVRANLASIGRVPGEPWRAGSSTDFGNVSQVVPAALLSVDTWPHSNSKP